MVNNTKTLPGTWVLPLTVCAAATVMCLSIFAAGSHAQGSDARSTPLRRSDIATVNLNAAYKASAFPAELDQYRNQVTADLIKQMQEVSSAQYLSKIELSQFLQLITQPKRTPDEDKQLAALVQANSDRSSQLATLQTKPESALLPPDTALIKQLEARSARLQQLLQSVNDRLQSDARDRIAAREDTQKQQVITLVQAVAKSAGYHEVWSQDNLVYCENDITPLVVKKLPH